MEIISLICLIILLLVLAYANHFVKSVFKSRENFEEPTFYKLNNKSYEKNY